MTGHLPRWLPDLMSSLQFVFPFETRLMYFYVSSLDRDRAMQKLIDLNAFEIPPTDSSATGSSSSSHAADRLKPRLDKRKKTINRSLDLFKQADAVLSEFTGGAASIALRPQARSLALLAGFSATASTSSSSASKPPLLEIQYENEVGTGLGPTLEFYALVSLEMQKCCHDMWRGERMKMVAAAAAIDVNKDEMYFFSPSGLFPAPISLYIKGKK